MTLWRLGPPVPYPGVLLGRDLVLKQFGTANRPFRDEPRWADGEGDVSVCIGDFGVVDVWRMISGRPMPPPGSQLRRIRSDDLLDAGYRLIATPSRRFPHHGSVVGPFDPWQTSENAEWWHRSAHVSLTRLGVVEDD